MSLCDHDHPQVKLYREHFNAVWTPEREAAFKRSQARPQPSFKNKERSL